MKLSNKKSLFILFSVFSIIGYSFVVFAAAPNGGYTPGTTLDPDCAPGDTDCIVALTTGGSSQWDDVVGGINYAGGNVGIGTTTPSTALDVIGMIQGSNLNITGDSTTIGTPAGTLTTAFNYGSGSYGAYSYEHNYRVYSYVDTAQGRVYSPSYLTIAAPSGSAPDTPTNVIVNQTCSDGCNYTANGYEHNYRIYGYKIVGNQRIYSSSYADLASNFVDDNSSSNYDITVSWTASPDADGYRVLKYDPDYNGYNYNAGYDTTSTSFVDDSCGSVCFNGSQSLIENGNIIDDNSGNNYEINISWNAVSGADGYRILKYDPNYNGYNYDAGYDTTSTSFVDDACGSVCFDSGLANIGQTSAYTNVATINGQLTLTGPIVMQGSPIRLDQNRNFGVIADISALTGTDNIFFGADAGDSVTTITNSNFFGTSAGSGATSASYSNFFGLQAGQNATNASDSNFLGVYAGMDASGASNSNFLGRGSGTTATNASNSNFLGLQAGQNATNASNSNFLGRGSGTTATNASYSNFFGFQAGTLATDATNSNFLGQAAGYAATNAYKSNFLGSSAGRSATNANNSNFFGNNAGYQATNASESNFIGYGTGYNAINAADSNFFGNNAGSGATSAFRSNFIGRGSGTAATNASNSNFLGPFAGAGATSASYSNFLGANAGYGATNASNSNFLGPFAGFSATNASYSNFFGLRTGFLATNASNSNFLGFQSGYNATNAANSIFIGKNAGYGDTVNNTVSGSSIAIGDSAGTGGFSNSIALGASAVNTSANQLLIGSSYTKLNVRGIDYTWPSTQAAGSGYVLTNDGAGGLSWSTGLSIGGTNGQLQYNNAGSLGGVNGVTFDGTNFDAKDNVFRIVDNSDTTKRAIFEVSGIDAGTTRTYTFPNTAGTIALTSDFSGYLKNSIGISGGTTLVGGTASGENLTLSSTSNATKGKILFGTSAYDEVNNQLGIGTTTPSTALEIANGGTLKLGGGTAMGQGNILMNSNASIYYDSNVTYLGSNSQTMGMIASSTPAFLSSNGPSIFLRGNSYGAISGQRGIAGLMAGNPSSPIAGEGELRFYTGANAVRMVIGYNGNVGIGTATPLNKLDVYGDLTIGNGAGAALKYNSTVAGGGSEFVIQPIYSGTSIVSLRPAAGSSLAPALRLTDSSTDAGGSHAFSFGTGSASLPANAWNFFSTITGNANTNSWPIYFGVSNPSKGRVVAMTIDNTANVGIGTTSPGYKLDIQGAAAETSVTNTTNNYRISFGFPSASGGEPSLSAFTTGVTNGRIFQRQNSTKDVFMGDIDANGGGVHIRTNGNDSLNILSGGNVGIGQSSPTAYLHLKAGTATAGTAPLKLTSGTNLTTPENGTFEYDGSSLFFTRSGTLRAGLLMTDTASPFNTYSQSAKGATAFTSGTDNFLGGQLAGGALTAGSQNVMIGTQAGNLANAGLSQAVFLGYFAGQSASGITTGSVFVGSQAGQNGAGSYNSNFIGQLAGFNASNAYHSNLFGYQAGYGINANNVNFFGQNAGYGATSASYSNFFGQNAGANATSATNSNFFGYQSGLLATNASYSNFLGQNAGNQATNAKNSIFIGTAAGNSDTVNNTGNADDFSILIGNNTSTGGFSNSIALGGYATNTASNQFMIGSTTRPITSMVLTGDYSGGSCTFAVGGMSCSSDERLKTNIEDLQSSTLDTVINIRTVHYNWNGSSDGPKQVGFIAQDLQQYFPELVSVGQGGYLQVNYAQMTPILVEAIREMNLKITTINNMDTPNTWRDSLIAWFGNMENGITELFAGRVRTHELCLDDVCVTKDQLQQLLQNSQQTIVPSSGGNPPTDPDPVVTPDDTTPSDSDSDPDSTENPDDSGDSNSDTPTADTPTE